MPVSGLGPVSGGRSAHAATGSSPARRAPRRNDSSCARAPPSKRGSCVSTSIGLPRLATRSSSPPSRRLAYAIRSRRRQRTRRAAGANGLAREDTHRRHDPDRAALARRAARDRARRRAPRHALRRDRDPERLRLPADRRVRRRRAHRLRPQPAWTPARLPVQGAAPTTRHPCGTRSQVAAWSWARRSAWTSRSAWGSC